MVVPATRFHDDACRDGEGSTGNLRLTEYDDSCEKCENPAKPASLQLHLVR